MAQQDIVPGLLDEIEEAFEEKVNSNRTIKQIEEKISKKTAQLKDGHAYAQELGESLSGVLQEKITPETLPDGKLYWNIADRTVRPMLEQNHKLVNDTAVEIQSIQDEKDGIELQPVGGEFPEERIHGLIDKMTEEPDIEKALGFLGEPIVNNTAAFFDQFIEANADFRHKAGLHEVIERVGTPGACPWCAALAGTRDYSPGMDRDVFRRHENCRCLVTFKSGKRRQNVWSKELWEEEDGLNPRNERNNTGNKAQKGKDVTLEYIAREGHYNRRYSFERNYSEPDPVEHSRKIKTAKLLARKYDLQVVLKETIDGELSPDFEINEKLWDLKSVSTEKAANSAIRHGLKQIEGNPGGIILNYEQNSFDIKELNDVIGQRMGWYRDKNVDIMIIAKNEILRVFRFRA